MTFSTYRIGSYIAYRYGVLQLENEDEHVAFATFTKTSFARPVSGVQIATYCAAVALLGFVMIDRADAMVQHQRTAGLMTRAKTLNSSPPREILTFTLQGTLQRGQNGVLRVPGPFGKIGSLAGALYTLQYQFDPSYGVPPPQSYLAKCPKNSFYAVTLDGNGNRSPGIATLSINGGSYSFHTGGSGSSAYANFSGSPWILCSPMYDANFAVRQTVNTLVTYHITAFRPNTHGLPVDFNLPVDIWLSAFWPAPNCKYTISPQVFVALNNFNLVLMNFFIDVKDTNLSASGLGYSGASFTVTNSLYPCKS
jgi:hypothetical protein